MPKLFKLDIFIDNGYHVIFLICSFLSRILNAIWENVMCKNTRRIGSLKVTLVQFCSKYFIIPKTRYEETSKATLNTVNTVITSKYIDFQSGFMPDNISLQKSVVHMHYQFKHW